jgi:uncharacterized caspase-like protein
LVVGNSDYKYVSPLSNPANDAKLIAKTLAGLGFKLVGNGPQLDLSKSQFDQAVQDFGNAIQGADVALFYYAGHGVQVRGANFLVPVSANPTREVDVDFQMLDVNLVLREMEYGRAKLNLVILDACRNNPFGGRGLRAMDGGLAQMQAPEGTLISFATQPGNVARDGADGDSPYSKALADTMSKPGLDIFRAFNEVGLVVSRSTNGEQQPWMSLSPIKGDFYFAGLPEPPKADPLAEQSRYYDAAARVDTREAWDSFLSFYKTGYYADLARAERKKIVAAEEARAKAEADALAKAEEERRANLAANVQQIREADAKAARDAALKAASQAVAAEKAQREAEAKKAQEQLEQAERETASAKAAQEAAAAAQQAAEKSAHDLKEALEKAKQDAAADAAKRLSDNKVAALAPGATPPLNLLGTTDIVRLVKVHLQEVGCDPGELSGIWDERGRQALEQFNQRAGTKLDLQTINVDTLESVRTKTGRVCPAKPAHKTANTNSDDKSPSKPTTRSASIGTAGSAADLLYKCRSNDRASCESLCKAGFDGPCRKLGRMRNP